MSDQINRVVEEIEWTIDMWPLMENEMIREIEIEKEKGDISELLDELLWLTKQYYYDTKKLLNRIDELTEVKRLEEYECIIKKGYDLLHILYKLLHIRSVYATEGRIIYDNSILEIPNEPNHELCDEEIELKTIY